MVRLIGPLFSEKATGIFHRVIAYRKSENTQSCAKVPGRIKKASAAQTAQRELFGGLCADWQQLAEVWKERWSVHAPAPLSGFSWFIKCKLAGIDNAIGYRYKFEIVLDKTNVDEDLTHFAVCVHLGASVGQNSYDVSKIFDELGENSLKIAVTSDDQVTELYVEVGFWDSAGEKAILWVSHEDFTVLTATDTDLFFFYDPDHDDNTDHVGFPGDRPEVWHPNILARYGCAEDPSGDAPQLICSSSPFYHLTSAGVMTSADLVASPLGKGIEFDGVNDTCKRAFMALEAFPFSLQTSFKISAVVPTLRALSLAKDNTDLKCIFISVNAAKEIYCTLYNTAHSNTVSAQTFNIDDEVEVIYVCSSTTSRILYVDGAYEDEETGALSFPTELNTIAIGAVMRSSPLYGHSVVDEAIFWDIALSAAWVKASRYTKIDDMLTWGD